MLIFKSNLKKEATKIMNILAQNDVTMHSVDSWNLGDKYLRLTKKSVKKLICLPPSTWAI